MKNQIENKAEKNKCEYCKHYAPHVQYKYVQYKHRDKRQLTNKMKDEYK